MLCPYEKSNVECNMEGKLIFKVHALMHFIQFVIKFDLFDILIQCNKA